MSRAESRAQASPKGPTPLENLEMTRRFAVTFLIAALGLLAGCAPPWTVVRQIVPNPMLGQTTFAVMPIDFTGVQVGSGSEGSYLADKDGDSRRSWADDKASMNSLFAGVMTREAREHGIQVVPPSQAAPFAIHPKVVFIEPGFFTVFINQASEVQMFITISTADGMVLDEITVAHATPSTLTTPGVGMRLRDDAEAMGAYAARYLTTRVTGLED
jgi:hypothetical protein